MAREHGVFHTAKVLRLEYGKLKRMVQSARPIAKTAAPAFVELVAAQTGGLSECLIELEGPHGKMRIQWKGTTARHFCRRCPQRFGNRQAAGVRPPPAFKAPVNPPHSMGNIRWLGRHRQSSFRPLDGRLTLASSPHPSHAGLPKGHFVYAGPMLNAALSVSVGVTVVRDHFAFADLISG